MQEKSKTLEKKLQGFQKRPIHNVHALQSHLGMYEYADGHQYIWDMIQSLDRTSQFASSTPNEPEIKS